MKRFALLFFICVVTIFASCSNDFCQRRYLPGVFLNDPSKVERQDKRNAEATESTCVEPVEGTSDVQPTLISNPVHVEMEQFQRGDSLQTWKNEPSISVCDPPMYTVPTDTIPPPQLATRKELRTAQLIATGCLIILAGSWFFLPAIGIVGLFLIHFIIGAIGLIAVAYGAENKNKFLNGLGVMIGISMAALVIFGFIQLIYCTFLSNCQP